MRFVQHRRFYGKRPLPRSGRRTFSAMGALINPFGYDARIELADGTKIFFETNPPEQMGWLIVGKGEKALLPESLTTAGRAIAMSPEHEEWIIERTEFGISLLKEEAAARGEYRHAEGLLMRAAELQMQLEALGTEWDDDDLVEITRPCNRPTGKPATAPDPTGSDPAASTALQKRVPRTQITATAGGEIVVHTTDEHLVQFVDLAGEKTPGSVIVDLDGEAAGRLDWRQPATSLTVKCKGRELLVKVRFAGGAELKLEIVLPAG